MTDGNVDALRQSLSASPLSHADSPCGFALRRYPAFSCGVQRKRTTAVEGSLMGGLPLGRLGLSMSPIMWLQIFLDKPSTFLFNVATLNQEAKMMTLMEAGKKTEVEDLKPGWYVVGFDNLDGTPDYGPIYEYHGEGFWSDESGEEIETLFDPILQLRVATDAADFYVRT